MREHKSRRDIESDLAILNRRLVRQEPGSEEKFRICLESLLDGFALLSAVRGPDDKVMDFRYDYINEAGCRLSHRTREEILGRRLLELLPNHPDGLFEAYCQVVETGEPLSQEILFYEDEAGGEKRLHRAFDFRAVRLGDGFAVAWRDTTEHVRAVADLREQEAKFRAIYENSFEAILLTTPDGGIHAANPAACRMMGLTEAEICAGGRAGLVDATDPRLAGLLAERTRTGRLVGELTFKRKDGTRFPGEVSSRIFCGSRGKQFTAMIIRELSDRKLLEARSQRLAALVETSQDAIYASNLEGIITDWNEGATALYGYSAEEAIGRPPSLIVPEDLLPDSATLLAALRAGQPIRNHETLRQRKDGTLIHVSLTASPIVLPDGSLSGISIIAHDITARIEATAEREKIIRELQAALAEVRTLSGLVPICAMCKRIRDDQGFWTQVEKYIQERSKAQFTHGICPECATICFPDFKKGVPRNQE